MNGRVAALAMVAGRSDPGRDDHGTVMVGIVKAGECRLIQLLSEDPLMLRALERLLRKAGYEVVATDTWSDRLSPPPALVIVDIPDDRTGPGALIEETARRCAGAPPILWIGGSAANHCEREACLAKPFTSHQLLAEVASLLAR
ncbi:MAG TPA: response regulator [Chloroflexota bacterium]|nr:response regulator [Chloroflexota bacterium]